MHYNYFRLAVAMCDMRNHLFTNSLVQPKPIPNTAVPVEQVYYLLYFQKLRHSTKTEPVSRAKSLTLSPALHLFLPHTAVAFPARFHVGNWFRLSLPMRSHMHASKHVHSNSTPNEWRARHAVCVRRSSSPSTVGRSHRQSVHFQPSEQSDVFCSH